MLDWIFFKSETQLYDSYKKYILNVKMKIGLKWKSENGIPGKHFLKRWSGLLTSDKIDLRCIEEYFIMIKGSTHQEEDIKAWTYIAKMEKAMATHSSALAWKLPWKEEPGRLQSMRLLSVGQDWATSLSLFTFHFSRIGEGNGNQYSCLENPRDGGAWWAAIRGVAQSRTRLKRLSSSSILLRELWQVHWAKTDWTERRNRSVRSVNSRTRWKRLSNTNTWIH